jgi:trimethylamine:corrinoid methyltransferase-like protein
MISAFYLLDGHEPVLCTLLEWAEKFKSKDNELAIDTVGEVRISTVFLGINHNFNAYGKPVLFETMVFNNAGDSLFCDRYTDWDSAMLGHQNTVKEYQLKAN